MEVYKRKTLWKDYLETKIIRGIRTSKKALSNLNEGDRFLYKESTLLIFINLRNPKGEYLAISERGKKHWLKGETEILFVHGIAMQMSIIAGKIKKDVLNDGFKKFITLKGG